MLNKNTHLSKISIVMQHISDLIQHKKLLHAAPLPSLRVTAKQLNFSVSTVVEAYERLAAQGTIEARAGAGYFVVAPQLTQTIRAVEVEWDREIDPLWISRQSLEGHDFLKPGCGWLKPTWMPEDLLRKAMREVTQESNEVLSDYTAPLGYPLLRQLLSRRLQAEGVETLAEQILLTDSATQSLDLIFRLMLNAGDHVLVDDPCYFNFRALLKVHQVKVVAIPFTDKGPDLEAFQQAVEQFKPKFYLTNTAIHNPTGMSLSLNRAYQILKIAEQHRVTIIEDNIFSDFEETLSPRYAALAGLNAVIVVGSFSKTISAAIRCGYIAARADWIDLLINLKIATSFSGNDINSRIIYHVLSHGQYRKYVEMLKLKLAKARSNTIEQLSQLGISVPYLPKAGMFLWAKLSDGQDSNVLAKTCLKQGVILAPGQAFSQAESAKQYLRFNVAQCQEQKVFSVLAKALKELGN